MADARHASGDHLRVHGDRLPAVLVGRRGLGHPPDRSAIGQDHAADVAAVGRPGPVGMLHRAERGASCLMIVILARPLHPFRGHAADRHATEPRLAGGLQVDRGPLDGIPLDLREVEVDEREFLDRLELELARAAVIAVGLATDFRDPEVAGGFQSQRRNLNHKGRRTGFRSGPTSRASPGQDDSGAIAPCYRVPTPLARGDRFAKSASNSCRHALECPICAQ